VADCARIVSSSFEKLGPGPPNTTNLFAGRFRYLPFTIPGRSTATIGGVARKDAQNHPRRRVGRLIDLAANNSFSGDTTLYREGCHSRFRSFGILHRSYRKKPLRFRKPVPSRWKFTLPQREAGFIAPGGLKRLPDTESRLLLFL